MLENAGLMGFDGVYYPLVSTNMVKTTMLLMGQLTISTWPCSSSQTIRHYQRLLLKLKNTKKGRSLKPKRKSGSHTGRAPQKNGHFEETQTLGMSKEAQS